MLYCNGDYKKGKELICEIANFNPLPYDKNYFKKREQCIFEVLNNGLPIDMSSATWNDLIPEKIGRAWNFWGKYLLFTDIESWTI